MDIGESLLKEYLCNGGSIHTQPISAQNALFIGMPLEGIKNYALDKNFFFHPLLITNHSLKIEQITYEVGSEEGVLALLVVFLSRYNKNNPLLIPLMPTINDFDCGYLASESNFGEEECNLICQQIYNNPAVLYVGEEILYHKRAANIFRLLGFLDNMGLNVVFCFECKNIKNTQVALNPLLENIADLEPFNGICIYTPNPLFFNKNNSNILYGSVQFSQIAKLKDKQNFLLHLENNKENLEVTFEVKESFRGIVGLLLTNPSLYKQDFPYKHCTIKS